MKSEAQWIEEFMIHSQDEPPLKYIHQKAQLLYPDAENHNLGVLLTQSQRMEIRMKYRLHLAKIGARVFASYYSDKYK